MIYTLIMLEKPCFSCICALKILIFSGLRPAKQGGTLILMSILSLLSVSNTPPLGWGGLGQHLRYFDYKNQNLRYFGRMDETSNVRKN